MAQPPPGLGRELFLKAARPLSVFVDPPSQRIRLEAKLEDGSELFLWMTAEQFQASLPLLRLGAQRLGIPWPSAQTGKAKSE